MPGDQANTLGEKGEELAARHLIEKGYRILKRNYSYMLGEIDIIAMDGDILAFIEVKTRSYADGGPPILAVNERKQRLLQKTAERFIVQNKLRRPRLRYDIVSIVMGRGAPNIEIIKNAF
ncbi:MAG: YraN family protein [Planctomycetota bacterium]|nr:YraN family protein [Planctomycetota bacterium]